MPQEKRIPANIFDEMAGLKDNDLAPVENNTSDVNPSASINFSRLRAASIPFLSKIQKKFVKQLYSLGKLFLLYNNPLKTSKKIKKNIVHVKIIVLEPKGYDSIKKEVKEREKTKSFFERAWDFVLKCLKKLFRYGIKRLVSNSIKKIFNKLKKLSRNTKKGVRKGIRTLTKTIRLITKIVFKSIKKLIKTIWKLISKLFFRGRASNKMFDGEPSPSSMNDPSPARNKNRMRLRMRGIKRKESFIMKAFKRIMKAFMKFIKKLCSKVLKKIIKKIIKIVVRIIIKIVAAQVIGSIIPGLGNIIMGAISAAMVVIDVLDIVNFITDVSKTVANLSSELAADVSNSAEDAEEDAEEEGELKDELNIDEMSMEEVHALMRGLENRRLTSLQEYTLAKTRYLNLLAEQYAKEGNEEISELILNAMNGPEGTPGEINGRPSSNVANLDLSALEEEINKRLALRITRKYENKRVNIFDDSEITTLLTGEEDEGPMWVAIWREFMWFIKLNMPIRLDKSKYEQAANSVLMPHLTTLNFNFNVPSVWKLANDEEKNKIIEDATNKIATENVSEFINYESDTIPQQSKFNDVIDRSNHYKFDALSVTHSYRIEKTKEVNAQRTKHNKLLDCLLTLADKRGIKHEYNSYVQYSPLLEPGR
jgi:hypothetical protein